MKVGILGTGKIVQEFLPWLVEHAPFTVQALCSTPRSAEKAQELCRQYGVPQHTTNYLELLQWVDVVYIGVYNVSYIVGLFGEPNQVHYTANVERGIDTSGILTMDYTGFKAVSMAAKDCAAPARCIIQGTKGYIQQKSTANCCGGITFHPNEGKEEHYNLNGGRPREAAEFETFARAMESGDQELCTRMQDTSIAVSRVLTVARRSAGIRFPGER